MAVAIHWNTYLRTPKSDENWCDYLKAMDREYGTDKLSPLHHDNRCPIDHAKNPQGLFDTLADHPDNCRCIYCK